MAKMRFAVLLLAATSVLADEAPIGVFDSGLGGLTVLERLLDVDQVNNATGLYGPDGVPDLAREHFVYLGDQANMPYGDYSSEGKSDYLRELILKDAKFLLGTSYYQNAEEDVPSGMKKRVKIIVIACNTATAWGLDDIRRYLASVGDGTKVVGVIEAGVRATLDQLAVRPDSPPFAIGVMATPGTIASGAYARTIRAELKARGVTKDIPILNQGCAGLADAVEAGSPSADAIARSNLVALVEQHRASGSAAPIRAVILGCTHYPFVLKTLNATVAELRAKGAPLAPDFRFVDPAFYTAAECHRLLKDSGRLSTVEKPTRVDAYLSVPNPKLPSSCLTSDGQLTRAFKYGRAVGSDEITTKPVPFTRARFGDAVFANIGRLLPRTAALVDAAPATTFYFDSEAGNDANDGLSPATAWQTLDKANAVPAKPGDRVLFKRGGVWRGTLTPKSGAEGRPVLYASYGKGPKPAFQQSVDRSRPADWYEESPGVWSTAKRAVTTGKAVWGGSIDGWGCSFQDNSKGRIAKVTENGETFVRATCTKRPDASGYRKVLKRSSIQLWGPEVKNLPSCAVLKLRMRASKPFMIGSVAFTKYAKPFPGRLSGGIPKISSSPLTSEWQEVDVVMAGSGGDGSLHFSIGDVMPPDCSLDIQVLGLVEATVDERSFIPRDVGIVILNHGEKWGVKRLWGPHEIKNDFDYWYDPVEGRVVMKCARNPGEMFSSIELAKTISVVNEGGCHDVVYDGLAVRYTGAHGFGGGGTRRITIRNCDIYWLGGGLQYWQTSATGRRYPVRFGNGIEFWGHCRNNLVERNRLWQIYDAALTSQTLGSPLPELDIVWRDNVVWQAEYSFEYWNHDPASRTCNILVEHNTFVDAGYCWSHNQRPNPNGAHLMLYDNPAATTNFVVRNNVFVRTTEHSAAMWNDWRAKDPVVKDGLVMENNLYYIPENKIFRMLASGRDRQRNPQAKTLSYGAGSDEFAKYRAETGLDRDSIWGLPEFVDPAKRDYRLKPDSFGTARATDGGPMGARDMPGLDADQSRSFE